MDQERAALGDIGVASLLRLGVGGAPNHGLGAVGLDLRDLSGRCDFRHEDARADPELPSGEGDGRAVIAARGGGATGRGCRSREKVVEGAARLERAGRLKAFELQRQRRRAVDRRGCLEERRATNVFADSRMSGANVGRRDDCVRRGQYVVVRQPKGALSSLRQAGGDERVALPQIGLKARVVERAVVDALHPQKSARGEIGRRPQARQFAQDCEARLRAFEADGEILAVRPSADGEHLAADLPDARVAPLHDMRRVRQAFAKGVIVSLRVIAASLCRAGASASRLAPDVSSGPLRANSYIPQGLSPGCPIVSPAKARAAPSTSSR